MKRREVDGLKWTRAHTTNGQRTGRCGRRLLEERRGEGDEDPKSGTHGYEDCKQHGWLDGDTPLYLNCLWTRNTRSRVQRLGRRTRPPAAWTARRHGVLRNCSRRRAVPHVVAQPAFQLMALACRLNIPAARPDDDRRPILYLERERSIGQYLDWRASAILLRTDLVEVTE